MHTPTDMSFFSTLVEETAQARLALLGTPIIQGVLA